MPASNVDELRKYLTSAGGMGVAQFKTLPVYRWHVGQPGFEWLAEL